MCIDNIYPNFLIQLSLSITSSSQLHILCLYIYEYIYLITHIYETFIFPVSTTQIHSFEEVIVTEIQRIKIYFSVFILYYTCDEG